MNKLLKMTVIGSFLFTAPVFGMYRVHLQIPNEAETVNQETDEFRTFFLNFFKQMNSYESHPYAQSTARGLEVLFEKIDELSVLKTENERAAEINRLTGLIVEPGFAPGRSQQEVRSNLLEKVLLLKRSFLLARERGILDLYFVMAFSTDPCFNGRIIGLNRFMEEMVLGTNSPVLDTQIDSAITSKYFALLEEMMRVKNLKQKVPSVQEFISYLKESKNYQSLYQADVESHNFNQIYNEILLGIIDDDFEN